jgi:hypothetical protein
LPLSTVRWLTALFVLFLLAVIYAANRGLGPHLFGFIYTMPGGDKLGHFLLIGTLAFLANLSFGAPRVRLGSLSLLAPSVVVGSLVTLEEASQLLFPARTFSLTDLACDFAGILLFGRLAAWIVERRQPDLSAAG